MTARLRVRVTPRGGRDALEGIGEDGVLRARVAAAPTNGKANDAITRLIARAAGVPPTRVRVVIGATARVKTVEVEGVDFDDLAQRLGAAGTA